VEGVIVSEAVAVIVGVRVIDGVSVSDGVTVIEVVAETVAEAVDVAVRVDPPGVGLWVGVTGFVFTDGPLLFSTSPWIPSMIRLPTSTTKSTLGSPRDTPDNGFANTSMPALIAPSTKPVTKSGTSGRGVSPVNKTRITRAATRGTAK
jgi:hypothetical protein